MADERVGKKSSCACADDAATPFPRGAQHPQERKQHDNQKVKNAPRFSNLPFFGLWRGLVCAPHGLGDSCQAGINAAKKVTLSESRGYVVANDLRAAGIGQI
jgi:hypothetical protein